MNDLYPKVAILPITYKCNLQCKMCNIWKQKENDIPLDVIVNFFSDPNLSNSIESVNITGGEPLLRKDICDIIDKLIMLCPQLYLVTINTNGISTESYRMLIEQIDKIRKKRRDFMLSIYISLDGIGSAHDEMRGRKGTYEAVINTLHLLADLKKRFHFSISLNFTITPNNYIYMDDVMDFAIENRIPLDYTFSMSSPMYFTNSDYFNQEVEYLDTEKDLIIQKIQEYKERKLLSYSGSYYRNLMAMIKGEKRKFGCIFQKEGFFLHPSGDVYLCWAFDKKIGNIFRQTFSEMWNNIMRKELQESLLDACAKCYNNCYVDFRRMKTVQSLLKVEMEK